MYCYYFETNPYLNVKQEELADILLCETARMMRQAKKENPGKLCEVIGPYRFADRDGYYVRVVVLDND